MPGTALSGAGSLISAVGNLFGSSSSGQTGTTSSSRTSAQATSATTATQQGNTTTTGQSSTVNSADPAVIALMKQLAGTALNNSDNALEQTQGLIAGLFQNAKDSFASVFGNQGAAGIYDSSSTEVQENATMARTTADAAQAVLNYQTTEQGIGSSALQDLLQATSTSSVNTNQVQSTDTTQTQDTAQSQLTNTKSAGTTQTNQNSGKASVVCTYMYKHGMTPKDQYQVVSKHFIFHYTKWARFAYLYWGYKLVKIIEQNPTSSFSRFILWLFANRTEYICAQQGLNGTKKTWKGLLAKTLIYYYCAPLGFYVFFKDVFNYILAPEYKKV
jgi:hypothetical protein